MSSKSFENTYWVSISLTQILPTITEWISKNLFEKDLVDEKLFKNRVQNDPHISVLLGLPRAPDEGLVKLISNFLVDFKLDNLSVSFGKINAFPLETKVVAGETGNEEYKYQVLHIEVVENKSLLSFQEAIGNYYATPSAEGKGKICWHHPKYNPHITIAFVKEGVAEKFINTSLFHNGDDEKVLVKEVVIKKFGDKSFTPLVVSFNTQNF
jgi:2'-5' RNA ligase